MKRLLVCLILLASSASAQIVEHERTFADLTASHPCNSGLVNRNAIVTDCDALDDIGDGGGAFRCFAHCDGTAPWETVAIGGGGSSGTGDVVGPASSVDNGIARFDSTTGKLLQDGSLVTLSDVGNLQWEGTTADAFEGNFTFADPTEDWTWAWGADGALTGVGGMSVNANGRVQTGNGTNGGVNFGGAGARISDSNNDGRMDFIAGGSSQADIVDVGAGSYRMRVTASSGLSAGNVLLFGNVTLNADTTFGRIAAGHTSLDAATHLTPTAAPPRTCDATGFGDLYVDTSLALCFCDSTSWQVLNPLTIGVGTCS